MIAVQERGDGGGWLQVTVESVPSVQACRECGVVAHSHGRRTVRLIDTPCFGRPVQLLWRKRTWRCVQPGCAGGSFTEQREDLAGSRALLTGRACWWAVRQLRAEHASVSGIARELGTTWRTVWAAIRPLLAAMAADESRFDGVATIGVDEHIWHHVSTKPIADGGRDQGTDRDGGPEPRRSGPYPGTAAGSGPGPLRGGLRRLAGRPRRHVPETASRSPRWTRSTATRTPSTTSCRTRWPYWTPSTS
ncbi:MAG: hypothetical protein V9E82_09175 [Candidatus Nanopelagicales bacterium]